MSLITGLAVLWIVMGVLGLFTMLVDILAQGTFFMVWQKLWQPAFTITITHQVAKPAPVLMTAEVVWEEEEEEITHVLADPIVPIVGFTNTIDVDGWDEVKPSITKVSSGKQLYHVWKPDVKGATYRDHTGQVQFAWL